MAKKTLGKKTASNRFKANRIIKAISIIDYVYGILLIIFGLLFFLGGTLFTSIIDLSMFMPPIMGAMVGGIFIFAALIVALGAFYLFMGKSISEFKLWAKIVQIILAVLWLFSFPMGTVIGAFILWVLLINKGTKGLFK